MKAKDLRSINYFKSIIIIDIQILVEVEELALEGKITNVTIATDQVTMQEIAEAGTNIPNLLMFGIEGDQGVDLGVVMIGGTTEGIEIIREGSLTQDQVQEVGVVREGTIGTMRERGLDLDRPNYKEMSIKRERESKVAASALLERLIAIRGRLRITVGARRIRKEREALLTKRYHKILLTKERNRLFRLKIEDMMMKSEREKVD